MRPQTDEEIAEALGAVAVKETDENGDASFDLPAGCYYAVINCTGVRAGGRGVLPERG